MQYSRIIPNHRVTPRQMLILYGSHLAGLIHIHNAQRQWRI